MISELNIPDILRRKNASFMPENILITISSLLLPKSPEQKYHYIELQFQLLFHIDPKHGFSFGGKNTDQKNPRIDGHGEFLHLEETT